MTSHFLKNRVSYRVGSYIVEMKSGSGSETEETNQDRFSRKKCHAFRGKNWTKFHVLQLLMFGGNKTSLEKPRQFLQKIENLRKAQFLTCVCELQNRFKQGMPECKHQIRKNILILILGHFFPFMISS